MKRLIALLVALVVTALALVALLGPCGEAIDPPPPPAPTSLAPAAPTPRPVAPRRGRARTDDSADADGTQPDGSAGESRRRAETHAVRVRVVALDGRSPIAGARVDIDDLRAVTDARGDATLERLEAGAYAADVRARGYAPAKWRVDSPAGEDPLEILLAAGVVVPVDVVDADTGRPVAGASVTLRSDEESGRGDVAVTDAAGHAEAFVEPNSSFTTNTVAAEHIGSTDSVTTAGPGVAAALRITLARAGAVRGVVRGPDDKPVERATVELRRAGADGELVSAEAGDDGTYAFDELVLGAAYTLRASGVPGGSPDGTCWSDACRVAATPEVPAVAADLRLRRNGTLRLDVLDGDAAIEQGLHLRWAHESEWNSSSGGDGSAAMILRPGLWTVTAWIEDRVPVAETFDVREGETLTRTIRLSRGATVSGVVVDDTGEAVEDARVRDAAPAVDREVPRPAAQTDADGRFAVALLQRGGHDFEIDPPYEYEGAVVRGVAAPSENLRLVVRRRGRLALHAVFDDDARPALGARIAFHAHLGGGSWDTDRVLPPDGRFEIAWPADVSGEVAVAVEGFIPVTRNVTIPLGGSLDLGDVRFRLGCVLTGVLRDAAGRPMTATPLVARGAARDERCVTMDQGRFTFRGLAPGIVRIEVDALPRASFRVDVPRRDDVMLVVPEASRLRVFVAQQPGTPIAGRRIDVLDADGERVDTGATGANGEWDTRLVPGRYTVVVEDGPRGDAEVKCGDTTDVRLK